eukprot:XP_008185174.2 PREDICTED: zinc finger protein 134-like isoform X1 [Acyrthosiphon pisum]
MKKMPGYNPNAAAPKLCLSKNADGIIPCIWSDCGRAFKFKSHTIRHMILHAAIGFHECPTCKGRFRRKDGLTRHMREKHANNVQSFKCKLCLKAYRHKNTLTAHINQKHSDTNVLYECTLCQKKFQAKKNFNYHMSSHSNTPLVECDECGATRGERPGTNQKSTQSNELCNGRYGGLWL